METRIFVFFGGNFFKLLLISQAVKLCVGTKLLLEMVLDSVARNEADELDVENKSTFTLRVCLHSPSYLDISSGYHYPDILHSEFTKFTT